MMIGAELKAARARLEATQEAFAEALEVTPRTLGRWERGEWPVPRVVSILVRAALKHAWIRQELAHAKAFDKRSGPDAKGASAAP
jgi:transcriptional regulator with XRE-family HTH domain